MRHAGILLEIRTRIHNGIEDRIRTLLFMYLFYRVVAQKDKKNKKNKKQKIPNQTVFRIFSFLRQVPAGTSQRRR